MIPQHKYYTLLIITFTLVLAHLGYSQNPTRGLVLHYSFDEGIQNGMVIDKSGNGIPRHGTVIGNPTSAYKGLYLNCIDRNNTCGKSGGDWITMPTLEPQWQEGLTVSAWVKFEAENRNFERIIDLGDAAGDYAGYKVWFGRSQQTNDLQIENWHVNDRPNISILKVLNGIIEEELHHYVASISPTGTLRIYVDGKKLAEKSGKPMANVSRSKNYWGHSNWCDLDPDFRGLFDELRLYNRELSETEVIALFQIKPESLKATIKLTRSISDCTDILLTAESNATSQNPSYKWYFNGRALNQTTSTIRPMNAGSYYVVITDNTNCQELSARSAEQIITFPSAEPTVKIGKCNQAILSAKASNGSSVRWIGPNISPAQSTQDSLIVMGSGSVIYKLLVYPSQSDTSCHIEKTVAVNFSQASEYNYSPTSISTCQKSFTLTAPLSPNYDQYSWLSPDGKVQNKREITATQSGSYTIIALNSASTCSRAIEVTVQILPAPTINLGTDASLCEGASLLLRPNLQGATYTWQDGTTANEYKVDQSGEYSVTASVSGCVGRDTIKVTVQPKAAFDLGDDLSLCESKDIILNLPQAIHSGTEFKWSDGTKNSSLTIRAIGTYWLESTLNGCVFRDSLRVLKGTDCTYQWRLLVPDVFTPNGDGQNDSFKIQGTLVGCEITIYNRWGEVIYNDKLNNNGIGWDGKFQGEDCLTGSYRWHISCQATTGNSNPFYKTGNILLIR
jgi:gliding motility-associated-like protein